MEVWHILRKKIMIKNNDLQVIGWGKSFLLFLGIACIGLFLLMPVFHFMDSEGYVWFNYVLVIVILGGLLWGGYFKVKQNIVTLRRYLVVVALSFMKILYSGIIVWVLFCHVVLLLV